MSLIAWYPLNGDLKDYSGNKNDGEIIGNPAISDGLGQLCYNFRYDDKDSISLGSLSNILNTIKDGFAINVWFNSGDVTKPQNIIFKDESFYIRIKDSVVQCAIHGPSGWNIAMNETMVLKSNRWYNVTLICDDSMMKTFINGYYTYKGNISPIEINDEIAYVGYSPTESGIGSFPFNGKIQDIRIHNKNISEDEIVKMYKYGANPFYDQI